MPNPVSPAGDLVGLDLEGVAISASVAADGALESVGGVIAKLITAARDRAVPRVHTVIVAADQDLSSTGLQRDPRGGTAWCDPHDDFVVLPAATLADAVVQLQADRGRWPHIDCALGPRDPDFVGRDRLFALIREHAARPDAGYLVLVGGMGVGKSTLLAEYLQREVAAGRDPVYHLITHYTASSADPRGVARCLTDRLRRKYRLPVQTSDEASPATHLEATLQQVAAHGAEVPEVLYLDAADQADADVNPRGALLPHTLKRLPRGVTAVITTRHHLGWLQAREGVRIELLDEWLDDRTDIRRYLERQQDACGLSKELVQAIVSDPVHPPVFKTVSMRVRDLRTTATTDADYAWHARLRTEAALWTQPPEAAIADEIARRLAEAKAAGIREDDWWATLALLLAAQEPVTVDTLHALDLWEPDVTSTVLRCAASFFKARGPYRFDHPGYVRALRAMPEAPTDQRRVTDTELRRAHTRWAASCRRWATLDATDPARTYALRHRLAHLREARDWDGLTDALLDVAYLGARLAPVPSHDGQRLVADSIHTLLGDVDAALAAVPRAHTGHTAAAAVRRTLHTDAHLLRADPTLLPQQLYNALIWDWKDSLLGRRLREQAADCERPWLRLAAPLPLGLAPEPALHSTLVGHINRPFSVVETIQGCEASSGNVNAVAISTDGGTVFSGADDGTVRVWDVTSTRCKAVLAGDRSAVVAVAVTPDGTALIGRSRDRRVRVWDPKTGSCRVALSGPDEWTRAVAAPFGDPAIDALLPTIATTAAAASRFVEVRVAREKEDSTRYALEIWDREASCCRTTLRGDGSAESVSLTPDGAVAIVGSFGWTRIWDTHTGKCQQVLIGHNGLVTCVALTPDGEIAVTGSEDRSVRVWNAVSGRCLATLVCPGGWVTAVAVTPDGRWVAAGSVDSKVRVWDTLRGVTRAVVRPLDWGTPLAISDDGSTAVSGGTEQLCVWHGPSGTCRYVLNGHRSTIQALAMTSDGAVVVSADFDSTVRTWDARSGIETGVWRVSSGHISSVAVTPSGSAVFVGDEFGGTRMLVASPSASKRFGGRVSAHSPSWAPQEDPAAFEVGNVAGLSAVAVAEEGATIINGYTDGTVRAWHTGTGVCEAALTGHVGRVTALTVSPDGGTIVSGSSDRTVRAWDTARATCRLTLRGHGSHVTAVALALDGSLIVSADNADAVRVWDARTGTLVAATEIPGEIGAIQVESTEPPRVHIGAIRETGAVVTFELIVPARP